MLAVTILCISVCVVMVGVSCYVTHFWRRVSPSASFRYLLYPVRTACTSLPLVRIDDTEYHLQFTCFYTYRVFGMHVMTAVTDEIIIFFQLNLIKLSVSKYKLTLILFFKSKVFLNFDATSKNKFP